MKSEKENILIIEKNSDGVLKLTLNDDQKQKFIIRTHDNEINFFH